MAAKKCFVISPIGAPDTATREAADDIFDFIVKPALDGLDIEAVRADKLADPGLITEQMIAAILNYDLCIADLERLAFACTVSAYSGAGHAKANCHDAGH
jgi:hypothetical protein